MKIQDKINKNIKDNLLYFLGIFTYVVFLYFQNYEVLHYGRYFAEEGSIFWSYSLTNNFFDTLFFVDVMTGYYSFNTNVQIVLTKFLNIRYGPLFTTWTSLFISFLPSILYFSLNKNVLNTQKRILISFILLTLPSLNFLEVFANSINSKTYLGIASLILLLYGFKDSSSYFFQNFIILIAFMSSYYSIVLAPLFFIRLLIEKNKNLIYVIFFGILSGIIHLNVLIFSINNKFLYDDKFINKNSFEYILEILRKSILINLVGEKNFQTESIGLLAYLFLLFIFLALLFLKSNYGKISYIILSYLIQLFLLNFGQIGLVFNQRYAVVISTTFFLLVIKLFENKKFPTIFIAFYLILCIGFLNQRQSVYFAVCDRYCYSWPQQVEDAKNGKLSEYIHWPIGEGDPYWTTDFKNPVINPAPFQKTSLGDDYVSNASITLKDIFFENIYLLIGSK